MTILDSLKQLNIGEYISKSKVSKEYFMLLQDADFIDETLDVLNSDNIAHKKNYFIDNQENIMETIKYLNNLLSELKDIVSCQYSDETAIKISSESSSLLKVVSDLIIKLETGIERFNSELVSGISKNTRKEDIVVTQDTIKDAMINNDGTKQIVDDLRNKDNLVNEADVSTKKIRDNFKDSLPHKNRQTIISSNQNTIQYLIASQDLSEVRFVPGINISKEVLNKMIEKSGIEDARIFELKELKTRKRTIQKIVTVLE